MQSIRRIEVVRWYEASARLGKAGDVVVPTPDPSLGHAHLQHEDGRPSRDDHGRRRAGTDRQARRRRRQCSRPLPA